MDFSKTQASSSNNPDFFGYMNYNKSSRPPRSITTKERVRHPPHLKGKQIGLFYASRNKGKESVKDKKEKFRQRPPMGEILLSQRKKDQIEDTLRSLPCRFNSLADILPGKSQYEHIEESEFKHHFLKTIQGCLADKLNHFQTNIVRNELLDHGLWEENLMKMSNSSFVDMYKKRKTLPSFRMKEKIIELIEQNQVILISGETGCGKTTQVPQFILDDYCDKKKGSICKVICTQPRRISAISVAERVATERAERLGEAVGYQIRLEKVLPRGQGSITFCTTGVVLKQMESDPFLSDVSHIILDEIHERNTVSDFLITLLKQIIEKRKDLKVILMSATLNAESFSEYYNSCPHINIPGFTYPVQEYFLEDVLQRTNFKFTDKRQMGFRRMRNLTLRKNFEEFNEFILPFVDNLEKSKKYSRDVCIQLRNPDSEELNIQLIFSLLLDICQKERDKGAVLVFVTGFSEISALHKLMENSGSFPKDRYIVIPLHSQLPTIEQKQIFVPAPAGKRKIVIATNIAETSITIDDVVFVIDCGRLKMTDFDAETNTESLQQCWVAKANASQRKGRAGRVKPGVCFHLLSRGRYERLEHYQLPEILRSRLEGVILNAKMLQLGRVEDFFPRLMNPPDPAAIALALDLLKRLNALDEDELLTPLGYHLAKLPIAPQMGKMILFGAIFSCLDPILSIAASLDYKDPFQLQLGKEKEADRKKLELSGGVKSDHLLMHEVLRRYETYDANEKRKFCWEYFLSSQTLRQLVDLKKQFMHYLSDMDFVPNTNPKCRECNLNSNNKNLIKSVICAGLYPNVCIAVQKKRNNHFFSVEGERVEMHPKSVLSTEKYFDSPLIMYYMKLKSTGNFIHDGSMVSPFPVIFFGDKLTEEIDNGHNIIGINNNTIRFKCTKSTLRIIQQLRYRLNDFLEHKISHPSVVNLEENDKDAMLLKSIIGLLISQDIGEDDLDCFDDHD